jgi:hypothetical protein
LGKPVIAGTRITVELICGFDAAGARVPPMRFRALFAAVSFVVLSAFAVSGMAHHSLAMYDFSKTITLTGPIAKVEWLNTHVLIYIDAKDPADGKTVQWIIETLGAVCMEGQGIKESLAVGSAVTVRKAPVLKDGSRMAYAYGISDGATIVGANGGDAILELKSAFAAPPKPGPEPAVQPKPGGKEVELPGADPLALITTLPGYRAGPMGHCYATIPYVAPQPERDR